MKLNIKIDTNVEEPEALITTARMTEEVNRVADFISGLDDAATVILGMKDEKNRIAGTGCTGQNLYGKR